MRTEFCDETTQNGLIRIMKIKLGEKVFNSQGNRLKVWEV